MAKRFIGSRLYQLSMDGVLIFITGLFTLIIGAELVVRGGSRLAALLGIKPLVIGLTVVSIGTSLPELAVCITASLQGSGSLAVANITGANLINILFILGLSALFRPIILHMQVFNLDLPMMVVAAVALAGLAADGVLSQLDGGLMVGAAILYTVTLIRTSRSESAYVDKEFVDMYGDGDTMETGSPDDTTLKRKALIIRAKYATILAAGIGITIIGADWLVIGVTGIARALNISEAMLGLTVVAIGTSSPELITTVVATIRHERDVAIGTLLGSSIYNILLILGFTCLTVPNGLTVARQLQLFDIPFMTLVILACVPVFLTGKCISRLEGGLGVAAYLIYLFWIVLFRI